MQRRSAVAAVMSRDVDVDVPRPVYRTKLSPHNPRP